MEWSQCLKAIAALGANLHFSYCDQLEMYISDFLVLVQLLHDQQKKYKQGKKCAQCSIKHSHRAKKEVSYKAKCKGYNKKNNVNDCVSHHFRYKAKNSFHKLIIVKI
ncbi:hypothetical protein [Campylobacter hyointestinalis]|uniref:hypothetical protein n=1 Tax=Campylobacter hyointestinalis TaxID=198 RepID=UPI00075091F4|nr:hypothetical protein [Campylobacter hyointestinalis]PPB52823.1 hypothetical protein CDQ69_07310 [Campylobacter hyointestinalis subsp. hyointestinalis]PPB62134.1 hypothetical protein CDQ72_03290 [Campylobacter hyointestinalis subsp. hyointestinalis]PPB65823.1 hypothetical protein CDQ75_07550 [Campylobacter hyointestinalis subsp. hyointestinalis]PPB68748.1 hypothetical protein CDQ77_06820 [Campylobacter hyointestinalis subsp. hyointestinalis]